MIDSRIHYVLFFDIYRELKEALYRDLRFKTLAAQDVERMGKRKKIKPLEVQAAKSIKLGWQVTRQVQQELLQKKLAQLLLEPHEGHACIQRYPEAVQSLMRDFLRKANEQTKLQS